jgi:glucan phosphorylase
LLSDNSEFLQDETEYITTKVFPSIDLIIPRFYKERNSWVGKMKNSKGKIAYYFNTRRMMRKYATDAYL